MLLSRLSFTFCICTCNFLNFLLCLLSPRLLCSSCFLDWFFCFLSTLLELLFCLFSFALRISTNNLTYFLGSLIVNILSSLFDILPTLSCTFFNILINRLFRFHSCGFFGFILCLLSFTLNISFHILCTFFNISCSLFKVLLCLSGFLFSFRSSHLVNFLGCCFI